MLSYLPFNKCPTKAKLKLALKLRPMAWSNCLKCHCRGSRVSNMILSNDWKYITDAIATTILARWNFVLYDPVQQLKLRPPYLGLWCVHRTIPCSTGPIALTSGFGRRTIGHFDICNAFSVLYHTLIWAGRVEILTNFVSWM